MSSPLSELPDEYFATTWTDEDTQVILQVLAWHPEHPLLPLIVKAVDHIDKLQDRYMEAAGETCCCCDYDRPGDMCLPHAEKEKDYGG